MAGGLATITENGGQSARPVSAVAIADRTADTLWGPVSVCATGVAGGKTGDRSGTPSDIEARESPSFSGPASGAGAPDALSAVEHRPEDVVPHPLVIEYKLANRLRELVALPLAFESPELCTDQGGPVTTTGR